MRSPKQRISFFDDIHSDEDDEYSHDSSSLNRFVREYRSDDEVCDWKAKDLGRILHENIRSYIIKMLLDLNHDIFSMRTAGIIGMLIQQKKFGKRVQKYITTFIRNTQNRNRKRLDDIKP
jgi:hypothetical protein